MCGCLLVIVYLVRLSGLRGFFVRLWHELLVRVCWPDLSCWLASALHFARPRPCVAAAPDTSHSPLPCPPIVIPSALGFCVGCLVRSGGCLAGRLAAWLVGWLLGWLAGLWVGWLVGCWVGVVGCLVAWLAGLLAGLLAGWLGGSSTRMAHWPCQQHSGVS